MLPHSAMQQGVDSQRAGAAETHELRLANAVLTRDVEQLCQQIGMKKVPVAIGNWRAQAGPEVEEMVPTRPPPAHTHTHGVDAGPTATYTHWHCVRCVMVSASVTSLACARWLTQDCPGFRSNIWRQRA